MPTVSVSRDGLMAALGQQYSGSLLSPNFASLSMIEIVPKVGVQHACISTSRALLHSDDYDSLPWDMFSFFRNQACTKSPKMLWQKHVILASTKKCHVIVLFACFPA